MQPFSYPHLFFLVCEAKVAWVLLYYTVYIDDKRTHTTTYSTFTLSATPFTSPTGDRSSLLATSIGCHGNLTNCMQNKPEEQRAVCFMWINHVMEDKSHTCLMNVHKTCQLQDGQKSMLVFKSNKKSSVVKCTQKSNLNKSKNTVLEYYLGKSEPI